MNRVAFEKINLGRPWVDSEGWTCVNVYSTSGQKAFGRIRLNPTEGISEIVNIIELLEEWTVEE